MSTTVVGELVYDAANNIIKMLVYIICHTRKNKTEAAAVKFHSYIPQCL
jgi:hypothetical protein